MTTDRESWAAPVVLADGDSAYVRAIRPDDAADLLAFHERQPRENLYRRFFSPKPTLTRTELRHFTEVDFVNRVALVLEVRGVFAAWASYERWPGRPDADVAFMVDDVHQGKGIATLLLEHLAVIAHTNGVERFTADVLADNRPMLGVFARAGWPVRRHFESGVIDLEFTLDNTEAFVDSVEAREQRADSRSVARLLFPRSIAVVGASDQVGSVGRELWRNVTSGTDVPVFAVNPNHPTVGGVPTYASVRDIVDDVWLAVIACPVEGLRRVLDDCIERRVRGAVIITAVDGTAIDMTEIVDRARRHGMRIIGPASMGVAAGRWHIHPSRPTPVPHPANRTGDGTGDRTGDGTTGAAPGMSAGVQAALVPIDLPPGRVAISLQSGSLGASLLLLAQSLGMGLSWFVSLGDKADVSANDLLQFWEDDETTAVIAMYTETFGNPAKFARIARRVGRRRPIVAIRTGDAGLGAATAALYEQAGLVEVPTVRAMLDTARVMTGQPVPTGPRVAVISNSRSPGVLAGTALRDAGLTVVDAPVALDWQASVADFGPALAAALADEQIDAVMVIHAPPVVAAEAPIDEIETACASATKPVVAVMLGRGDGALQPGSAVPTFAFPEPAAAVLGRMWRYRRWLSAEAADEERLPDETLTDPDAATAVISAVLDRNDKQPTREELRAILAAYGLAAPLSAKMERPTAESVVALATTIGYPVAMKSTRRHAGRSAAAGVALDLHDDSSVVEALAAMQAGLGADANVVVIQAMVTPGVDVRLRASTDDRIGPVLTFGIGGIAADAIGDETSRLVPISPSAAVALVRGSRAGLALRSAGIDDAPLVAAIIRIGRLLSDHPEVESLDVNPAIVSANGCYLTDVAIVLARRNQPDQALRRLV